MNLSMKARSNDFRLSLGLGLSALLAVILLFSILSYSWFANIEDPYSRLDNKFVVFIIAYTVLDTAIILKLGIGYFGGSSLRDIGWRIDNWKSDLGLGFLGGAIAIAAVFLIGLAFGAWDTTGFLNAQSQFTFSQRVLFLLIGLSAGFIEESLFRGYLQPAAIKKFSLVSGLILSSLVFAAYHLKFTPQALLGKFILGLIFGLLRMRDQSLWRSGIAHATMWLAVGWL